MVSLLLEVREGCILTDACAPPNCMGGDDMALSEAALSALGGSSHGEAFAVRNCLGR